MISVPPISKCGPELKIRASPPNFFKQCSQKSTGPSFHRICEELLEIFSKILLCVVHCTISTAVEQRFPILGFILVHRFTGSARNSWRYSIRYYWIVQPEQLREGDKNVYCPINSTTGQYCRCGNMKSTYSISWLELSGFRKKTTTAVINSVKIGTSASQVGIPNVFTEIRNTNFLIWSTRQPGNVVVVTWSLHRL